MLTAFLIVMFILLALSIRAMSVNEAAYLERKNILTTKVFNRPDWKERLVEFDKVSYDKHVTYKMFFLDPLKLYDLD
jgi:hypothetical protein